MTSFGDPYRILGLTQGATLNEIRSAYRRLAKQFHPDAAGERALPRFLAIQSAYERLVDGEGRLRTEIPGAPRPGTAWGADPDRARATRDAYRARRTSRAGTTSTADRGPGGGPNRGTRPGTEWATDDRRGPGFGTPSGAPDADPAHARTNAAGSADGPSARPGSGERTSEGRRGRRPGRKATPGSTTYDEAKETPLDPEWQGAGWYGPASGTFWTINPREYADPRKHGPEYQARARRAAEVEAERTGRGRGGARGARTANDGPDDTDALGADRDDPAATAETDAAGASAGWAWTGTAAGLQVPPARRPTQEPATGLRRAGATSPRPLSPRSVERSEVPPDPHAPGPRDLEPRRRRPSTRFRTSRPCWPASGRVGCVPSPRAATSATASCSR